MKKIKKIACTVFMCSALALNAGAQTVNYRFNYNDPYDIRPLKINILLLGIDGYGLNSGVSAGLHAQYVLGKKFTFEAVGKYTYASLNDITVKKDELKSLNTIQRPIYAEGGAEWHFSDREVNRKLTVNLESGYNTQTNTRIPIKARKIYSLRGGVFGLQTSAFGSDDFMMFDDGVNKYGSNYVTTARTMGAYAGIATRRIDKAGIAVDGYGSRRRNRNRSLFADVMFGTTSLANLQDKATNTEIDISKTPLKTIGWRVGGQWMDNGTYTRVEFGQLPTISTPISAYISFTFGLTLFGNEKGLKKKPSPDGR